MTVEVLKHRNVDIFGIVIINEIDDNIRQTIEIFSGLRILAVIPYSSDLNKTLRHVSIPSEILEVLR